MEFTLIDNDLHFEYEGINFSLRRHYDDELGGFYDLYCDGRWLCEIFIGEIDPEDQNETEIKYLKIVLNYYI